MRRSLSRLPHPSTKTRFFPEKPRATSPSQSASHPTSAPRWLAAPAVAPNPARRRHAPKRTQPGANPPSGHRPQAQPTAVPRSASRRELSPCRRHSHGPRRDNHTTFRQPSSSIGVVPSRSILGRGLSPRQTLVLPVANQSAPPPHRSAHTFSPGRSPRTTRCGRSHHFVLPRSPKPGCAASNRILSAPAIAASPKLVL